MDLVDCIGEFKNNLVILQKIKYGRQLVFRFENCYGLSVIEENVGEGPKYNIAVIRFDENSVENEYELDYQNGITNKDVLTNNEEVVFHLLNIVKEL